MKKLEDYVVSIPDYPEPVSYTHLLENGCDRLYDGFTDGCKYFAGNRQARKI